MMKSVDFKTRECFRDGDSASLGDETITYLDVKTTLDVVKWSRIAGRDVSMNY